MSSILGLTFYDFKKDIQSSIFGFWLCFLYFVFGFKGMWFRQENALILDEKMVVHNDDFLILVGTRKRIDKIEIALENDCGAGEGRVGVLFWYDYFALDQSLNN